MIIMHEKCTNQINDNKKLRGSNLTKWEWKKRTNTHGHTHTRTHTGTDKHTDTLKHTERDEERKRNDDRKRESMIVFKVNEKLFENLCIQNANISRIEQNKCAHNRRQSIQSSFASVNSACLCKSG